MRFYHTLTNKTCTKVELCPKINQNQPPGQCSASGHGQPTQHSAIRRNSFCLGWKPANGNDSTSNGYSLSTDFFAEKSAPNVTTSRGGAQKTKAERVVK